MKNQLVRSRRYEEVHAVLSSIVHALRDLGNQQACVLHCLQPHRSNFYRQLELHFDIRVLPCHPGSGFKATVSKAVLGVSALIVIDHYEMLPSLFSRIGEQAIAALYVINKSTLASILNSPQLSTSDIVALVEEDPEHFVYKVDEDSATEDDQVVELISTGRGCPQTLRKAVGLDKIITGS